VICAMLRTPPGRHLARRIFFGRGSFPDIDLSFRGEIGRVSGSARTGIESAGPVDGHGQPDRSGAQAAVEGSKPGAAFLQGHGKRR